MNDSFPKGRTEIFLPDPAIMFEIGLRKDGDIDFIVGIGEDKIVMRTTPIGAGNIGLMLKNASVHAMSKAVGMGEDPILDELFPIGIKR